MTQNSILPTLSFVIEERRRKERNCEAFHFLCQNVDAWRLTSWGPLHLRLQKRNLKVSFTVLLVNVTEMSKRNRLEFEMTRSKAWYAQGTLFLNPDRSWNRILICWSLVQRWHTCILHSCLLWCESEEGSGIWHFYHAFYVLLIFCIKLSFVFNTFPSELFSNFILTFFGRVVIFPLPLPCKFRQGLAPEFIWPPGRQKKDICGQ